MAFIGLDEDQEEAQRGALGAGGGARAPAPAAPQPSRFVGFSRFLDANRDAAQAQANKITQGFDQQAAGVQSALGSAQNTFGQQVKTGSAAPVAAPAPAQWQPKTPWSAAQKPAPNVAQDQAEAAATYTGPAALSQTAGWDALTGKASKLQDSVNATQSPSAVQAMAGGGKLSGALVGAVGGDQFAQARAKYSNLAGTLRQADDASRAQATAASGAVATRASEAQGRVDAHNAEIERLRQEAEDARLSQEQRDRAKQRLEMALKIGAAPFTAGLSLGREITDGLESGWNSVSDWFKGK